MIRLKPFLHRENPYSRFLNFLDAARKKAIREVDGLAPIEQFKAFDITESVRRGHYSEIEISQLLLTSTLAIRLDT